MKISLAPDAVPLLAACDSCLLKDAIRSSDHEITSVYRHHEHERCTGYHLSKYNPAVATEQPTLQRAINNISFFLLGVTALGTVLDSAGNAITLVSPAITWIGFASIAIIWLGTHLALRLRAVRWRTLSNATVHPVSIPVGAKWAAAGVLGLLLLPRIIELGKTPNDAASLLPPPRIIATERTTVFVFVPNDEQSASVIPRNTRRAPTAKSPIASDVAPAGVSTRPSVSRGSDDTSAMMAKGALPSGGFLNKRFFARAVDGRIFTSQNLVGKVVVVNMWATWCQPCRAELPLLAQFARSHSDRVIVLAVAEGEDSTHVRQFAKSLQLPLPLIPDKDGQFSKWFPGDGVVPRTYVVAADGQVIFPKIGPIDVAELERTVLTALSTRPAS